MRRAIERTWRGFLLTVAVVSFLIGCQPSQPAPGGLSLDGYGPSKSPRKVWLLAWDGVSRSVIEPLLERGELPNLSGLIERGVFGDLQTEAPVRSPIIWTSVATGKSAREHHIDGFWYRKGYRQVLFNSTHRQVKTLWNIATERERTAGVIGWWVTWPVEPIRGVMVSDRYILNRFMLLRSRSRNRGPRQEEELVYPPEAEPYLSSCVLEPLDVTPEELDGFLRSREKLDDELHAHNRIDELRIVYARDRSNLCMARRLLEESQPDLLALYIQGTDIVCHYFWKYRFPEEWREKFGPIPEDELERYRDVIEEYYKLQDRYLGELLALADEETTVCLLSDHGFRTGMNRNQVGPATSISGTHRVEPGFGPPPGVVILSGSGIRPGAELEAAHIYDIAPTILTLMGLPVGRDMPGRVLTEALLPDAETGQVEVAYVESYETPGSGPGLREDVLSGDQERIRQLEAIGYVGVGEDDE